MATSPTVQNDIDLENYMLDSLRTRAIDAGFEFLSTLIEERLRDTSPSWFRDAAVLNRVDNYLHSGTSFAYLQVALTISHSPDPSLPSRSVEPPHPVVPFRRRHRALSVCLRRIARLQTLIGKKGDGMRRREFLHPSAIGRVGLVSSMVDEPGLLRSGQNLFTLGVASGDPTPNGVVLWTRLAPDPLNGG